LHAHQSYNLKIFSCKIEGLYKCLHFLPSEVVCLFSDSFTLNHETKDLITWHDAVCIRTLNHVKGSGLIEYGSLIIVLP